MALLSESDYDHTIQALEYYLEAWGTQLSDVEHMEKQALICWLKISKSKLCSTGNSTTPSTTL